MEAKAKETAGSKATQLKISFLFQRDSNGNVEGLRREDNYHIIVIKAK